MRLSPKYTLDNWNAAFQGPPAWDKAIDIVQDRIEGRFTRWIDPMLPKEFAGFAIIALDCLLLETLHGFLTGASTYQTRNVYKEIDRKSTRLNSSHRCISYAVFCLKK